MITRRSFLIGTAAVLAATQLPALSPTEVMAEHAVVQPALSFKKITGFSIYNLQVDNKTSYLASEVKLTLGGTVFFTLGFSSATSCIVWSAPPGCELMPAERAVEILVTNPLHEQKIELSGVVGVDENGRERYFSQTFYWKDGKLISRDTVAHDERDYYWAIGTVGAI